MALLFIFFSVLMTSGISASAQESLRPYVMGALGDSISAGFNSYRLGDNRSLSWSTGTAAEPHVESHAKKMAALLGRPIETHNEAFAGATSHDLSRETTRLLRYKPDYVTVLIGANDLCNWDGNYDKELAGFTERLETAVDRLVAANSDIRIVMSSLPNIMSVYQLGVANGCSSLWNAVGVCKALFSSARTPAERTEFSQRFFKLNEIIKEVAGHYPANAVYKPEVVNYQFPREFLSAIDCFHPSILGHGKIAELTFDPSWH